MRQYRAFIISALLCTAVILTYRLAPYPDTDLFSVPRPTELLHDVGIASMWGGIYIHNNGCAYTKAMTLSFAEDPNGERFYGWDFAGHYFCVVVFPTGNVFCPKGAIWWTIRLPLWMLLGIALTPSVIHVYRVRRRKKQQLAGICMHCGYDLRASPTRCPECGSTVPSPSNRASVTSAVSHEAISTTNPGNLVE
jgi:hypothetical protein